MKRFAINTDFDADCVVTPQTIAGEAYRVERNAAGGANLTPIARFFAWRPEFAEGFHAHWRVDCFVRIHPLAPDPAWLAKQLVSALMRDSLCTEPIWVSWYRSEEINGKAYGEVFELD